ncbi:MAG: class I SAM-dependent methyltransferase [Acidobacteria bacterium]|nr:class I SAM-dependent methyltransferase [Acidobacteriota bacterium]
MAGNKPTDIPGNVDFQNPAEARAWTEEAESKKPWREEFFRTFARELASTGAEELSVLELGSGPGFLAQRILEVLPHAVYTALDYSPAMHELARQRLGSLSGGVRFVETNFKLPDWNLGMPTFDAVISMQSVHEVRHKSRVPSLYARVRKLLHKGGLFLMCDHFAGEGGQTDNELYMTIDEQRQALENAGFSGVTLLLQDHGLALWRAQVA